MPSIHFSGITPHLQANLDLNSLSGRDKVALCRWIMESLGILDIFRAEPDATARAQEIITDCWNQAWDEKPNRG